MNKFSKGDVVCRKPLIKYDLFGDFHTEDLFILPFKVMEVYEEDTDVYSYRCESMVSRSSIMDVRHTATFQEYELTPWSQRKEEVIKSFERYLDKLRNVC